jgi:multiple sugar transport system permease protein
MAVPARLHSRSTPAWRHSRQLRRFLAVGSVTMIGLMAVLAFLLPLGYMFTTAIKTTQQTQDPHSQVLPASPVTFNYEGKDYPVYKVPTETGTHEWALVKKLRQANPQGQPTYESTFIDPANPQAGLIKTDLNWFQLEPVYRFDPTLDNFPASWDQINLSRLFRNTFIIAIAGTIGTLLSSICVAYGFSRFRIPGLNILFVILIATIILPTQVTLIPQYIFFRAIGWGGTWWPLIIPHFFANAYNVFLLRQYFKGIPRDLDEAATIDGATPLQTLLYVIIPQSIPAITAVGLFHFFWAWNDFFAPLIYLQGKEELYTISIGMTQFTNIFNTQPGLAMAAAMMTVALPVVIFFLAQRAFMQGIVITGVEK